MKNFIKLLPVFVAFNCFSQITITQTSMPVAGDTLRYSTVNPLGLNLNIGQKGANQSWDYSGLVSNGQDIYQYIAANKTPYFFYFFNQIGLKTADSIGVAQFSFKNIYSFYTKNSTVFKAEGLGYSISGIPLASNYTDDDEIYQFPLKYHDSDVSTFRFVFSIPGQNLFSFVQAGKRINYVDGWGSIKTPYKTYSSVLRVKTIVDEVDTLVSQFTKIPFPRKQVIYKWLSADERIPVLELIGTEVGSVFTATQIRYRDQYNGKANPFSPRARFTVNKTSGYANADTFAFTDQTQPFATSFQWQINPSSGVSFVKGTSANSRNPFVVFSQKGKYSVTLIATNVAGTDDTTATDLINIDFGAGAKELSSSEVIKPNPSSGMMYVTPAWIGKPYFIVDLQGRMVGQGTINHNGIVDAHHIAGGNYIFICNQQRHRIVIAD